MAVDINPIDLRDYAISLGWSLVREAIKDGLYVLNSPVGDFKQLVFSKEFQSGNDDQLQIVFDRLSKYTGKSKFKLVEEIREVNDDVISLRYFSEKKSVNSLPFESVIDAIEGTKQLILSAASTIINPTIYHPRLSRSEPNELLKKTKFRHTQEGSFVLKISCPVDLEQPHHYPLFADSTIDASFARKTFALMNKAAFDLVNAIESDNEEQFINNIKGSDNPILSYNFCDALLEMYDDDRELPFELGFDWSLSSKRLIPEPGTYPIVRFPYTIKPKIETIKNSLKPQDSTLEDTFIATVESLSGNVDGSAKRQGEVRLAVLLESTIVNVKVNLNAEQYVIADIAHMTPGSYIRIKGRLQPGKQTRLITDVTEFSLV